MDEVLAYLKKVIENGSTPSISDFISKNDHFVIREVVYPGQRLCTWKDAKQFWTRAFHESVKAIDLKHGVWMGDVDWDTLVAKINQRKRKVAPENTQAELTSKLVENVEDSADQQDAEATPNYLRIRQNLRAARRNQDSDTMDLAYHGILKFTKGRKKYTSVTFNSLGQDYDDVCSMRSS
ncbi:hypothetical protein DM01DRAFT_199927 [Hesseltinella vesiculosa]|uniref:Uncharacterized protein n=1 Tax=Hesseltinella vesiculosa TaxID=101127 RepID=A0A1X2GG63_9FUNG|nr:hypothetical protein DM01DRAFT_199927 [Hesseltinella vesiculosa]